MYSEMVLFIRKLVPMNIPQVSVFKELLGNQLPDSSIWIIVLILLMSVLTGTVKSVNISVNCLYMNYIETFLLKCSPDCLLLPST